MKNFLLTLLLLAGCNETATLNRDHPDGPPKEEECFHEYEPNDTDANFPGSLPSVEGYKVCGYYTPASFDNCASCEDWDWFWFPLSPSPWEENLYLYLDFSETPDVGSGYVGLYQTTYGPNGNPNGSDNLGVWYFDGDPIFVPGFELPPYEPGVADDLMVLVYMVDYDKVHLEKRVPYSFKVWTN